MALLSQLGGAGGGGEEEGTEKPREDEEKVPMQAGFGGASSAYIPGQSLDGQPPITAQTSDRTTRPQRVTMSHETILKPGETEQQGLVRLARERDQALQMARSYQIANELHALVGEGLLLEPREELDRLLPMDDDMRARNMPACAVRYQRVQGGTHRTSNTTTPAPTLPGQAPVPGAAVGQQLPVGNQTTTPAQQQQPMTRKAHDACVRLIDEGMLGDPGKLVNPMAVALQYLRSGLLVAGRNGRPVRPTEQVY